MLVLNDREALELERNYSWVFKLAEVQRIPEAMKWMSTQLVDKSTACSVDEDFLLRTDAAAAEATNAAFRPVPITVDACTLSSRTDPAIRRIEDNLIHAVVWR